MKKVLSILCIALLLCTSTITAYASNINTNSTNNGDQKYSQKNAENLQERSAKLAKRLEFLKFRQSLEGKQAEIRQNRIENRELVIENTQLRKDIVDSLAAIKENGRTISPEVQDQIKAYNQQIKDIKTALKETKGDIKEILTANKQNIKDMNYEAVDAAYNQVVSIQNNRAVQLQKINQILDSIKSLL